MTAAFSERFVKDSKLVSSVWRGSVAPVIGWRTGSKPRPTPLRRRSRIVINIISPLVLQGSSEINELLLEPLLSPLTRCNQG